ncbi:MAG TPA: hypothetical protein VFN95_10360, partial [Flavitalea sp.]|nr:hypothetical protein [Flavitalea sp.]
AISGLQAVPVKNSISEIPREQYRAFSPREKTSMPYLEGTCDLEILAIAKNSNQSSSIEATIKNFKWFDKPVADTVEKINFVVSRQGKVTSVEARGNMASWMSPEMASVVALLPTDGILPGDSWEDEESLRIPILQGTMMSPLRPVNLKVTYVHDEIINGHECRLLRSADEIWLNDLDVKVEDLLPAEVMNRPGGAFYRYFNKRGGKFLFKREQWVDKATGIVIKATTQCRILTWVQDIRKPVDASNADKDSNMLMSLAQNITIDLK